MGEEGNLKFRPRAKANFVACFMQGASKSWSVLERAIKHFMPTNWNISNGFERRKFARREIPLFLFLRVRWKFIDRRPMLRIGQPRE